jgi:hypothetical protein
MNLHRILSLCASSLILFGCSHALEIKNLSSYAAPLRMAQTDPEPIVGVRPWHGDEDDLFYYNAIVSGLAQNPGVAQVQTDFVQARPNAKNPDIVLDIKPKVEYRSSGWNFLINWPGFIIFTPGWHGYEYHADIVTDVEIQDVQGHPLSTTHVPMSYDIREAEIDRTIFTGLTWLEWSVLAFGGGIYNANVFDRDIIDTFTTKVKDNYTIYVLNELNPKFEAAIQQTMRPVAAAAPPPAEEPTTTAAPAPTPSTPPPP